ncbi:MAG: ABC transporter permease [Clostridiaceae bacterium]|nr:ABC transporter permease [Clostridiaceae bacterium]
MSDSDKNNSEKLKDKAPAEEIRDIILEEELTLAQQARTKASYSFFASLMAILTGLLVGVIVLFIADSSRAVQGLVTILRGGFTGSATQFGQVIATAIPIIMTGLSVAFAYRTGLFNIGASGQFMVGSVCAVIVAIKGTMIPASILWLVCMLAAIVGGAIWGAVPGILKAYFKVNEVITSIMMNYIGMYLVKIIIEQTIYDSRYARAQNVPVRAEIPTLGLDTAFPGTNLNISLLLCIIFCVIIFIISARTVFGYELTAVGLNPDASRYAGINSKRTMITAMVVAGALSGIGGFMMYLGGTGMYMETNEIIALQGFNGIPVALLAMNHPIGVFFSGLFIGHITIGGENLQLHGYSKEIIDMIIAVIIYCAAFSLIFKQLLHRIIRGVKKGIGLKNAGPKDSGPGGSGPRGPGPQGPGRYARPEEREVSS